MNASHAVEARACTCHPDDRPPVCQHRYGASECLDAWLVDLGRAFAARGSASDDEDAYAELRAARVRAAVARPPGLAGPLEFAVPAGQLAGLRYHVMVRGCV